MPVECIDLVSDSESVTHAGPRLLPLPTNGAQKQSSEVIDLCLDDSDNDHNDNNKDQDMHIGNFVAHNHFKWNRAINHTQNYDGLQDHGDVEERIEDTEWTMLPNLAAGIAFESGSSMVNQLHEEAEFATKHPPLSHQDRFRFVMEIESDLDEGPSKALMDRVDDPQTSTDSMELSQTATNTVEDSQSAMDSMELSQPAMDTVELSQSRMDMVINHPSMSDTDPSQIQSVNSVNRATGLNRRSAVGELELLMDRRLFPDLSTSTQVNDATESLPLERLSAAGIQARLVDLPTCPYSIRWSRRVAKRWQPDQTSFVPLANPVTYEEPICLFAPPVEHVIRWLLSGQMIKVAGHVNTCFQGRRVILMLAGVQSLLRRHNAALKRSFANRIRAQLQQREDTNAAPSAPSKRTSKSKRTEVSTATVVSTSLQVLSDGPDWYSLGTELNESVTMDRDFLDRAVLWIHIQFGWQVLELTHGETLVDWLIPFSRAMASAPYEFVADH